MTVSESDRGLPVRGQGAGANGVVLQGRNLSKRYGHVVALECADIDLYRGQVTALLGNNGAGKSTLVSILSGLQRPDGGDILMDGRPVRFSSTSDAREAGIATVFQNLALVDTRDVKSNLFLGSEPRRFRFFVNTRAMVREAQRRFAALRVDVPDLWALAGSLSGGQRQAIAVARAILTGGTVVMMDEPTASLGVRESQQVLSLIARLRDEGLAVLVVSHNLGHVYSVADRAVVLHHGRVVDTCLMSKTKADDIVRLMSEGR